LGVVVWNQTFELRSFFQCRVGDNHKIIFDPSHLLFIHVGRRTLIVSSFKDTSHGICAIAASPKILRRQKLAKIGVRSQLFPVDEQITVQELKVLLKNRLATAQQSGSSFKSAAEITEEALGDLDVK
jgi:hypothetical protein